MVLRGSYCRRSGTTSVADGTTRPPVAGVAQPPRFVERVLELDDGAVTCWGRNHPRWGSRSTYLGSMTPVTGDLVVYHAQSSPKGRRRY